MNARKALSGLAALTLALTLTACGGDDEATATQATGTDAAATGTTDTAAAETGTDAAAATDGASTMSDTPGTGADAYAKDDPFVGTKDVKAPAKTIVMASFNFTPKKITAKPGEVWKIDNQDIATHDVRTQDKKTIFSGDVLQGKKGSVKMPKKAGKYEAVCFYHQSMVLDITVK